MIPYTPPKPAESVPVIDLAGSFSDDPADRRAVAWEVHKACRDTGFFYITGHGVPAELTERHLAMAAEFFALPLEEKLKIDGTGGGAPVCAHGPSFRQLGHGSLQALQRVAAPAA